MGEKWSAERNGVKIGLVWDDPPSSVVTTTQAYTLTGLKIRIKRTAKVTDASNKFTWSGAGVVAGTATNLAVPGAKGSTSDLTPLTGEAVALTYGAQATAGITIKVTGIGSGSIELKVSIPMPRREFDAPEAVTNLLVTRESDESHRITWQTTSSLERPVTAQEVLVSKNEGEFTQAAVLAAGVQAFTYRTLRGVRYAFKVKSKNGDAEITSSASVTAYTTPVGPGACAATLSGTDVLLEWGNPSLPTYTTEEDDGEGGTVEVIHALGQVEIWVSIDNATPVLLDTIAAALAGSYTHAAPDSRQSYRYRVRNKLNSNTVNQVVLWSDWGGYSDVVALIGTPDAPISATVIRISDEQHSIAWERVNPDLASAPYESQAIDRQEWDAALGDWGDWFRRANGLSKDSTSWSDTSTTIDRSYRWRVVAANAAGETPSGATGTLYTRPANPSRPVVERIVSDFRVTWNDRSQQETGYGVMGRMDAGSWSLLGTTAADATSWMHIDPVPGVSWSYYVYANGPSGLKSPNYGVPTASDTSQPVLSLRPPAAPVELAATSISGSVGNHDATTDITLSWRHSALDGSAQTAFEIQATAPGGSFASPTWSSGKAISSAQQMLIPANLFANTGGWQWRVRTWGAYVGAEPTGSEWSAISTLSLRARPVVTITSPTINQVIGKANLLIAWTFASANNFEQSWYRATLRNLDEDVIVEVLSGTSSTLRTLQFSSRLQHETEYQVSLEVTDSRNVTASVAVTPFRVEYVGPNAPTASAHWDENLGRVTISITNPPGDYSLEGNKIYRKVGPSWELLATVGFGQSYTESAPPAGDGVVNTYRVEAVSALGTTSHVDLPLACPNRAEWHWVNFGPGFAQVARARLEPSTRVSFGRRKVGRFYAGRTRPVYHYGAGRTHRISFSGILENDDPLASEQAWIAAQDAGGTVIYRDPYGKRIYADMGELSFNSYSPDLTTSGVSTTFEEVSDH